jgi:Asp-tRNA(Asn)/Glu-tRNA(Gln) amidotransferase A subunit family amidase
MRISIKGNFALAGIKSTTMNGACRDFHDPKEAFARYVQKLIDHEAAIVGKTGKTKTSAFASAEEVTDQWIDYHCSFDPRGDKYQSPSGSTTGGAAALADHDWLDASIGTDSMFSCRWTYGSDILQLPEVSEPLLRAIAFMH